MEHLKVIQIVDSCEEEYYNSLCSQLQGILTPLVKKVQNLYPKREVQMFFGNGGCVVSFGGSNMFNPFINSFGNLNSFYELDTTHRLVTSMQEDHPLLMLCRVIDELVDMKGYTPPLDNIII